jgi:tetratricopeptide (TPR) repeat protein
MITRPIRVLALMGGLCLAGSANAQAADPVQKLAAEAAEHFEAGRYCHAVQAYRKAYRLDPLPELLYNIAYIHDRKLDDADVARIYYQRYVRSRDTTDKLRLIAYERLDAMQTASIAPPLVASGGTGVRASRAVVEPLDVTTGEGNRTRTAAWIALGVGAAATVTGATFAALATHSHSQFEDAEDAATRRELADEGEQRALIGDIGLGIGLAGLAAGGVLYLLSSEDEGPQVGIAPGGFGISGRF